MRNLEGHIENQRQLDYRQTISRHRKLNVTARKNIAPKLSLVEQVILYSSVGVMHGTDYSWSNEIFRKGKVSILKETGFSKTWLNQSANRSVILQHTALSMSNETRPIL